MKKLVYAFASLLGSAALFGQAARTAPRVVANASVRDTAAAGGATMAEVLAGLNAGLERKALNLDSTTTAMVFPAAGHITNGSGDIIWRSDVSIANYRSVAQHVAIGLLTQGADNTHKPSQHLTLSANTTYSYRDIVAQLGDSGLGSLVVIGVLSDGVTADTQALLDGASRIYTTNSTGGSLSQLFPAIPINDVFGSARAVALGLRQDPGFRTNVGVVNFDNNAHTFTAQVIGDVSNTFSVTVPAYSMRQVPIPAGSYGDLFVQVNSDGGNFWWSAYGASVDNNSGDSWSAHAALTF